MCSSLLAVIEKIVNDFGLRYAVVADATGAVLGEVGPDPSVKNSDLYAALFGTPEAIARLIESLSGQVLPQSWAQGTERCLVFVPTVGTCVALFDGGARSAVEAYKLGKEINERLLQRAV